MEGIMQQAEELKNQGNASLKSQKYEQAIDDYSEAIQLMSKFMEEEKNNNDESQKKIAIYYSNRAAVHLKMENYGLAINDADEAINYCPEYPKSYYRKADGLISIDKYQEAKVSLRKLVIELKVLDKGAQEKYKFVTKVIKERAFAQAIHKDEEVKVAPNELVVEEGYSGPRLEEEDIKKGAITSEWVQSLMDYQVNQKKLHKKYLWNLLLHVKEVLKKKSTLIDQKIKDEVEFTVCGDTHGQYYDLVNIFKNLNGMPSESNPYLFNGDFVDRGSFSVEVIVTLFAWMAHNPECMHLTRGNHEAKNMNKLYGFEGEVLHKYCKQTYELFCELFNLLPLCYILNKKVMVCHGGLFTQEGVTLDDIRKVDRVREPPDSGIMCDLLWADPVDQKGRHPSKRGISQGFGPDVTSKFLEQNNLELLVRSHEMKEEGYQVHHDGKCITIFSAPNYCDQMQNKGAFIKFKGDCMKPLFTKFSCVEHPKIPPMAYSKQTPFF